jgi:hypothetical protein
VTESPFAENANDFCNKIGTKPIARATACPLETD